MSNTELDILHLLCHQVTQQTYLANVKQLLNGKLKASTKESLKNPKPQ